MSHRVDLKFRIFFEFVGTFSKFLDVPAYVAAIMLAGVFYLSNPLPHTEVFDLLDSSLSNTSQWQAS